jgi:hypothetical protein
LVPNWAKTAGVARKRTPASTAFERLAPMRRAKPAAAAAPMAKTGSCTTPANTVL